MKLFICKSIYTVGLYGLLCIFALIGFGATQDFYYDYEFDTYNDTHSEDFGEIIRSDVIEKDNSVLNRLLALFQLSEKSWYIDGGTSKALAYVKMITNLLLSLVALVSLILLLYAFYLMFFSTHKNGITKVRKIITLVVISTAIVGLSWLIVSFIFYIQQTTVP